MPAIRSASDGDADIIVAVLRELAESLGETTALDRGYVAHYLADPRNGVFLAEADGEIVALVSWTTRPNLYHAGDTASIDEVIVRAKHRGRGYGRLLLEHLLSHLQTLGCAEVSVSALPDNDRALALYRALGLTDEAVLLEKHF
jgi:ribosomal protein S18 acetylase RimI-like enzyme